MQKNRIESIDSFRAIAILMVITFHFFSRWTTLYPYHNTYDFFGYGKFGVHFFFMISGFVIFFTLEKTLAFKQFWINRFIRLFPSMLFASVLTYLFFTLFDTYLLFPTSHSFKNIIVSLTFVQPDLISSLTRYQFDLDYISGSYWSLWVEIQFYLLASLLYFLCSKRFYSYFFLTATLLVTANFLLSHCYVDFWLIEKLKSLRSIFNLISALPFFCLGSIFFIFYKNNYEKQKNSIFIQVYFLLFVGFLFFNNYQDVKLLGLILLFILLFFFMIYYPKFISFLNTKFLNTIGISSYFLYLIHENIGVFLIHDNQFTPQTFSFLEPIIVILILIGISILFTRYIERYIISYLKALLIKQP